jgi:hypothetical protein
MIILIYKTNIFIKLLKLNADMIIFYLQDQYFYSIIKT